MAAIAQHQYQIVAFLIGVLVGLAELTSRYRDRPESVFFSTPGLLYLFLNGAAAFATLCLVTMLGIDFGLKGKSPELVAWTQTLAAGFGAMAVLRSSFFSVRAGGQDIAIGPSTVLDVILGATDRAVDRYRARARALEAVKIMRQVSFTASQAALPTYCLALMQNLSADDQRSLANEIVELRGSAMDEDVKTLILGLALMNRVGPAVVRAAVTSLGPRILSPATSMAPSTAGASVSAQGAGAAGLETAPATAPQPVRG